jgi:type VI secretion system secreted protein Hcp
MILLRKNKTFSEDIKMNTQRDVQTVVVLLVSAAVGILVLSAGGGSLEPTAPPSPTGRSLEEIYNAVHSQQASLSSPGFNAFLSVDGIPGESTDAAHQGWIEVQSFSWGLHKAGTIPTAPQIGDIVIVCTLDKSSPKLAEACCIGTHIPTVILAMRRPGGNTYMEYKMSDVLVSSFQAGGDIKIDVVPTEQISLNFRQVESTYTTSDGNSVHTCYNVDSGSSVCTAIP